MRIPSRFSLFATLALGAFFGWMAGSGKFDAILRAGDSFRIAKSQPSSVALAPTLEIQAGSCCDGANDKNLLVSAIAVHNARVVAKSQNEGKKPNICIIWGDDVGQSNISAYSMGLMGYKTPNIDRIAREGMIFTDYYGEQSCTAGRASFIMGQHGMRTGLTKVGLPGAPIGMHKKDPTIAKVLKSLGYATAQIGKNHLGDRDEHLPTMHGFD